MASKFDRDHFKKLQVNLFLGFYAIISGFNEDEYLDIYPKHVEINSEIYLSIENIVKIKELLRF